MVCRSKFTVPAGWIKKIQEQELEILPALIRIMLHMAIQMERENRTVVVGMLRPHHTPMASSRRS